MMKATQITPAETEALMAILKTRFEQHMHRHASCQWSAVEARIYSHPEKLRSLQLMEATGGEPDVVAQEAETGAYVFFDCSEQSPAGRRSLCYDQRALDARKANKPKGNVITTAADMGVELLSQSEYKHLQLWGPVDTKTSSWVLTPAEVRALGGAIFCDYRYGQVFTYHNGADSYYAARGFRSKIVV